MAEARTVVGDAFSPTGSLSPSDSSLVPTADLPGPLPPPPNGHEGPSSARLMT